MSPVLDRPVAPGTATAPAAVRKSLRMRRAYLGNSTDGGCGPANASAAGRAVAVGSRAGLAVQALDQNLLLTTNQQATNRLHEVVQAWRAAGCPDLPDYRARLRQDGADWLARLAVSWTAVSTEMTTTGRVQVRRWSADAPSRLVVLVHGYGEHIGRYEHVAEALAARGSTVVGPDHVGHGRSAGERVLVESFEPLVDDLRAVVQAERGDLPVVMVGHSMGGLIAIRYAQRHREDLAGLVLSGPAVGLGPLMQEWLAAPELPSDPLDATALSRDPAVGEAYVADPLVYHGGWKRPTLEAFVAADQAIAAGPSFGDLPLLYVHGSDDPLVPVALARPIVERLAGPDSELRVLAGARHEVFNELGKEEVIDLVASFAERVTAR
jgi:alpha-beta hydrolase superfamily lysophospholipase